MGDAALCGTFQVACEQFLMQGLDQGTWAYGVASDGDQIIGTSFVQKIRKVPKPTANEDSLDTWRTSTYCQVTVGGASAALEYQVRPYRD